MADHFVGIDPGQNGGLVFLGGDVFEDDVTPMPETEKDIWDWFASIPSNTFAAIEEVHSMPGQGVSSTFKFGAGYGGLRMALIASGIPFESVSPRAWQKALGIRPRKQHNKTRTVLIKRGKNKGKEREQRYGGETNTQWKNRLKAKAQQLFPSVEVTLKTADALLIAEYCKRKHKED